MREHPSLGESDDPPSWVDGKGRASGRSGATRCLQSIETTNIANKLADRGTTEKLTHKVNIVMLIAKFIELPSDCGDH